MFHTNTKFPTPIRGKKVTMSDFQPFLQSYGENEFVRVTQIVAPVTEQIFLSRLYEELDAIISSIEASPKEHSNDSEDRLSIEIVNMLKSARYTATKDPTHGGHVDIYVEPKSGKFKWYGEAKIWNGVNYLDGGMNQLLTRYASGKELNLGFLVYFKADNLVKKMSDWKEHLNSKLDVNKDLTEEINNFSFYTVHKHTTGSDIKVRHFSINIYWNPK